MKKLILGAVGFIAIATSAPASAADLPVKTPLVVPPPVQTWVGCYVGLAGGYAWGTSHQDNDGNQTGSIAGHTEITGNFDVKGGIFGGTSGCNLLQSDSWLFGVESDFSWTDKKGTTSDLAPFNTSATSETSEKWLETSRVRVGYLWNPNWLLYATAGAAIGKVGINVCDPTTCASESHTRFGWTAGAGVEYAFMPNWSVKAEYLYVDFGKESYFNPIPAGVPSGFANRSGGVFINDNIIRVGVNYQFGALMSGLGH